jgi:hypothetical protein
MKNKKKLVLFLVISAMIVLGLQAWDDEKLFTTIKGGKGKSNVVLIQDHTGSMCSIIYHPDFNPKISLSTYSSVDLSNNSYESLTQTSWYIRWVKGTTIIKSDNYATNLAYAAPTLTVTSTASSVKIGDWILQYDSNNAQDLSSQMLARVTNKVNGPDMGHPNHTTYNLTLADITGNPKVASNYRIYTYSGNSAQYITKAVKLYGSNIDQGDYNVAYTMDTGTANTDYLRWIFGVADDIQRQQVTDFSTLAYDVEYNAYLRPTPVSPLYAHAIDPYNSTSGTQNDHSETLLQEWNRVMKDIYPNKIANLQVDITNSITTIKYEKHKASFAGYLAGFKIKIDAETMAVSNNVLDAEGKFGTLTVTRGQNNTVAATHSAGAAIMIYNQSTSPAIDESKPLLHLFSSTQHVVEATGEVDPTFTETKLGKTCWRYKRAFTRIQVAREAICDVITAKNKLLKVAELFPQIDDDDSELYYCNVNPSFLTRVAPFYIKVSDPVNPDNDEIMLVTDHDSSASKLTVTRGLQGTSACAHGEYSAVQTYSGTRDLVRFGIFKFSTTDAPAAKMVDLNDFGQKNADGTYKAASYINTVILDSVDSLVASGATPLARALAYVWNYLKPNPGTGVANYINTSSTGWKAVDSSTFGTAEKFETIDGVTRPKGSPMEYWCQENYAVMITDGDSTDESGFTSYPVFSQTSVKTTNAGGIIADFFKFDYNRSTGPTPWGDTVNDGSEYLTDVAYFLAHQDMFPTTKIITGTWSTTDSMYSSGSAVASTSLYDESNTDPRKQWPGNQNIKTYTVGLCVANAVLPKAAKNGLGANFTATNYQDLSEAFLNIITSVVLAQDPMSYTTYAAPKQSITGGKFGYIAHFVPRERAMWEGHLRRYRLGDDGSFPNNIDNLADTVIVGGVPVTSFQWDAGSILNTRVSARVLYTSKPSAGNWPIYDFMGTSIVAADLDVTTAAQVTQVKNFILNFNKADGINANSDYNTLYRLGETFHFNPQLVGFPLAWKANFDVSYKSFYEYYSTGSTARTEVVYTGANDGKLHCFRADTGAELWSYVPFSLLKQLKEPALNPILTSAHTYFIDGKSLVKDIKVPKSDGTFYNDHRDWKTGLFFGMGIGGRAYCALDITNPGDLKVLWELNDSAETVTDGRMGFTEAKPVQVDMYGGSTLRYFPAVILAGGYNSAEVQATDETAQDWQRREGKSLYILNANSGALIKKFIYGSTFNSTTLNANPNFLTAFTAAPAVLDKNNDGKADVIYLAESGDYKVPNAHGGAIWKINCYGDPTTWQAQKIYQAPDGQTIFISPSLAYDNNFRVWVMFGTGRRSRPAEGLGSAFTNLAGQFVAFIDDSSGTTITNANLHNADTAIASDTDTNFTIDNSGLVKKGFFFNFLRGNEIMWEPQPLYINQKVYFMTFTPREGTGSGGSTDDPCGGNSAVNGSHYIYQFKLTSEANTFTIGDFLDQSGKILGYGPLDEKFTIYVGAGDAGNFKSDEGDRITNTIKDEYRALLWKEDKK